MQNWVPGTAINLTSADSLEDYRDIMRFNTEYLNTLCPNGYPSNLECPLCFFETSAQRKDFAMEQSSSTRGLKYKLLEFRVAATDKTVLIPQIKLISDPGSFSFNWARRQFPV